MLLIAIALVGYHRMLFYFVCTANYLALEFPSPVEMSCRAPESTFLCRNPGTTALLVFLFRSFCFRWCPRCRSCCWRCNYIADRG